MRFLLTPLAILYGTIIGIRNILFNYNFLKSKEYNIPIICVGNITVGGTGKTPHIEYLTNLLSNKKIVILSRGYGRNTKGIFWVSKNSNPKFVGDEPLQIKQKFPNTEVIVCESRRKGIEEILRKKPDTEVILLDDGFQHRWIKAGLSIVLNNNKNPIYFDHLLPVGKLREHKKEIKRADIIINTNNSIPSIYTKKDIREKLGITTNQKLFFSTIIYHNWKHIFLNKNLIPLENYNIILLSAVSDASSLKQKLIESGHKVKHINYPDHHQFTKKNIENILSIYKSNTSDKNIILSTEKDKVKLTQFLESFIGIDIYFIPINIEIDEKKKFDNLITDYVTKYKRNS